MDPLVSIIIPTYNRVEALNRAIASIVQQTYPHWELWVVDDGSTDSTLQSLEKWRGKDSRIHFRSTRNRGVSAARNLGIQWSRGPLVSFLDSDDEWLPEKLNRQVNFLNSHPEYRLVHGEEIWVRHGVRVNPMKKHKKQGGWIFENCLKLCCVSPSTVLLKRTLLDEVGLFREDFPACEDYDLWLRICSKYPVGFIPENLTVKYGGHQDQLSRKYHSMDYWRVLAMTSLLNSELSTDQVISVEKEIQKKSKVLMKGYRKYQNLIHYDKIFEICLQLS